MFSINGKFNQIKVFADTVEQSAMSQLHTIANYEPMANSNIRIMPDVHAGSGCAIGYTAVLTDKIIPNLIGVDIGCGVLSYELEEFSETPDNFEKLDRIINEFIPSGFNIHEENSIGFDDIFYPEYQKIFEVTQQDKDYVSKSLGTLGGGNHYIELGKTDSGKYYLTVHTGSRNFGLKICHYYQKLAKKHCENSSVIKGMEWLEGSYSQEYLEAMMAAQYFAHLNRVYILDVILTKMGYEIPFAVQSIESVHNYINFDDQIIRKGAISAHKGERVLIPLNMRDGMVIGIGKGNEEWNFSAPHGAGRIMSRSQAKQEVNLLQFQDSMNGIFSSSVCESTIDESPFAYKNSEMIINAIRDTVDIIEIVKPIYNYKAH